MAVSHIHDICSIQYSPLHDASKSRVASILGEDKVTTRFIPKGYSKVNILSFCTMEIWDSSNDNDVGPTLDPFTKRICDAVPVL